MPQSRLLHAAADLVNHHIGQLDGVEVVHHHGGMAKRRQQRAGVPAPGVQCDRTYSGQPVPRPSVKPAVHRGLGAVGHQVQEPALLQVDQAGHIPGRCCRGGLQQAGLVQAELGDTVQARRVVHQQAAVVSHRPGSLGQHRPRADRGGLLGPGPYAAGGLSAAPDALAPAEHHRPAASGQVTHSDRTAAMQGGAHSTARAADQGGRGLDDKLPLATDHLGGKDLEAVQAKQPGG